MQKKIKILMLKYTIVCTTNSMLLLKHIFMQHVHEKHQNGRQNA